MWMVKFLFIFSILWVLGVFIFIHGNNYSSKTLEVFIPVFGAMLFSVFLILKYVYLDAPKGIYKEQTLAVLHDKYSGRLYSMNSFKTVDDIPEAMSDNFGLNEIDHIQYFTKLQAINIPNNLVDTNQGYRNLENFPILLDVIEFTFINWFAHLNVPTWGTQEQFHYVVSGGSSTYKALSTSDMEMKVSLSDSFPQNNLIKNFDEIYAILPSKAVVTTIRSNNFREIKIKSKYSEVTYTISYSGGGVFDPNINTKSQHITNLLGLDRTMKDRYQIHNFITSWKFQQSPWFRDADEAGIHESWFDRIFTRYSKNFAWEEIEKQY